MPDFEEWPEGVDIDVIGQIENKQGWHVNVVYQGEKDLNFVQDYEVQVITPIRKWLGQEV
jgi:hypothetical protein